MLPLARYRFHLCATTPLNLPEWPGSVLRGAFGHTLRKLACMTRQKECQGCPLYGTCPYPAIFAPPPVAHRLQHFSQPPAPYVIEPAGWGARHLAAGESHHFDMVLVGRALRELPLIALAWRHALQGGIGPGDGRAELTAIGQIALDGGEHTVYTPESGNFREHQTPAPQPPVATDSIALDLLSPLRLQENGRALPPNRLTAEVLLMASVRRASLMAEFHGACAPGWNFSALKIAAAAVDSEKQLKWREWTRRSSRQQKLMQLGGVVGRWTLRGNLAPFLPALHLGQWLHIGKETVFGLGRYALIHNPAHSPEDPERSRQIVDLQDEVDVPQ
jgi:hypothetical protein